MKTVVFFLIGVILGCIQAYAGGNPARIVECTDGTYAVQEYTFDPLYDGSDWREKKIWRDMHYCGLDLAEARAYKRNIEQPPTIKTPLVVVE